MQARSLALAVLLALGLSGGSVLSQEPAPRDPMALGAAANFSAGWSEQTFSAATNLGLREYRDAIIWSQVERRRGEYDFASRRSQYPALLAERGARLVLTVGGGNPLYDGGQTPHSPEAVAAFARFVRAVVERYPAVRAVEVGNEFNSGDFVTGPVRSGGIAQRGRYHLALVRAVAAEVRSVRPDLPVLGGATHSLPTGYVWSVLDGAGPGLIDGLAVHPYTTPIDQLPAQVGVLRRNAAARDLPLYVTEWGTPDAAAAPDHLLRGYATMASLGFAALHWYPLNQRGDGMEPLIRADGSVTGVGEAFAFIQRTLAHETARNVSPDSFTFAHAFGDRALVLWGEPRAVVLTRGDIAVFDARGVRLDPAGLLLSPTRALVLLGETPIRLGDEVQLGCSTLIADSFYQFSYPRRGAETGVFTAQLRGSGESQPLVTLPGQQRSGVPWVPYLGSQDNAAVRLTAERLLVGGAGNPALVQAWLAPPAGQLRLEARIAPAARNREPLSVQIAQGGHSLFSRTSAAPMQFDGRIGAGLIEFSISHSAAAPAAAEYRWRVHDDARCPAAATRH